MQNVDIATNYQVQFCYLNFCRKKLHKAQQQEQQQTIKKEINSDIEKNVVAIKMVEINGSLDDLSKSIDELSSNKSVPEIIDTNNKDVYAAWRKFRLNTCINKSN